MALTKTEIFHFDYFLGDTIDIEKLKNSIVINNKGELLFPENDFGKRIGPAKDGHWEINPQIDTNLETQINTNN